MIGYSLSVFLTRFLIFPFKNSPSIFSTRYLYHTSILKR
nr:MAG TPA: hypothetical protein [Caudoviricetes sp.]